MPVHFVGSAAAITSTMPAGAARTNLRGGMLPWPLAVDQAREWVAPALSGAHGKVGSSISRAASRDHEHRRVVSGRVDRCPPHVAGRSSTLHQLPRTVDRCPIRSFRSRSGRCWLTRHRTAHGYSWSPPGHMLGDQRKPRLVRAARRRVLTAYTAGVAFASRCAHRDRSPCSPPTRTASALWRTLQGPPWLGGRASSRWPRGV